MQLRTQNKLIEIAEQEKNTFVKLESVFGFDLILHVYRLGRETCIPGV